MVTCVIFSILMVLLFFAYRMGASAWRKADTESELLQNLQVATRKIARPLEASTSPSVTLSVSPSLTAISYLSAVDGAGNFAVQPGTIKPEWQHYEVFYYVPSEGQLYQTAVDLLPGSPERTSPGPIENFTSASGKHPLSSYCTTGRVIARHLTDFTVQSVDNMVTIEVEGQMKRYGSGRLEQLRLRSATHLRNS